MELIENAADGYLEPIAKIVEEGDAEFLACLHEPEEDITRVPCAAGSFAFGDIAADVVLGAVGMEGDFRAVENTQEFILAVQEPGKQPIEGDEVGFAREAV